MWDQYRFGVPYLAVVALQVLCAVHAIRSGRSWSWLWLIIIFPVFGCLIYFLAEVYPDVRSGRAFATGSGLLARSVRKRKLRRLQDELQVCDTVTNRIRVAEECLTTGLPAQAVAVLAPCLDTPYRDDPPVLWGLAQARFHTGATDQAIEMLARLDARGDRYKTWDRRLLRARAIEALGQTEPALKEYDAVVAGYPGEEARCRQALLLKKSGQQEKARAIFDECLARVRRSPRFYARRQREWVRLARKNR